jgi:hypothetical protein
LPSLLYFFSGFFVYFSFMYMYIFGPMVFISIQVLFITWYTKVEIRVRVFSLSPQFFLCTSSSLVVRSRLFIAAASFPLPSGVLSRCAVEWISFLCRVATSFHSPPSSIGVAVRRRYCRVDLVPPVATGRPSTPSSIGAAVCRCHCCSGHHAGSYFNHCCCLRLDQPSIEVAVTGICQGVVQLDLKSS